MHKIATKNTQKNIGQKLAQYIDIYRGVKITLKKNKKDQKPKYSKMLPILAIHINQDLSFCIKRNLVLASKTQQK